MTRETVGRQVTAAVLAAAVLFGAGGCTKSKASAKHVTGPGVTTSAQASPSASASSGTQAALLMCSVGKMTVAIDTANTGEVSGRENVVFQLHNAASSACTFTGYPKLVGVGKSSFVDLKFPHATKSFSRGVSGSGPIKAGGSARFTATIGITGCSKSAKHYAKLGIELPGVQLLQMKFPAPLAKSGCPLSITRIGPVTA